MTTATLTGTAIRPPEHGPGEKHTVATYVTIVTYTCGHSRRYGFGQTPKAQCWCYAGIEKIEHIESVKEG